MDQIVRAVEPGEIEALAWVWHQGWHDAHDAIVPEALVRARTLESFETRLAGLVADTRVVGPTNAPTGLSIVKGDELYQLYVASQSRGTGAAAVLIRDAEKCLAARGTETAWLACAIGNSRAARFYEKSGWMHTGSIMNLFETIDGDLKMECWRFEKTINRR